MLIVNGDVPLLTAETLSALMATHEPHGAVLTVLTARVDNPQGLGRILRDTSGAVVGIVEERDANPEQLAHPGDQRRGLHCRRRRACALPSMSFAPGMPRESST